MMTNPTYQPPKGRSYTWLCVVGAVGSWLFTVGPSVQRARAAGSDWPALVPGPRFVFLDRLTRTPGKPIAQVLQEMKGYTVWEGNLESGPPQKTALRTFPANFTGTLSFANNHDPDYVHGYYWIAFKSGIATEAGIFDD